MGLKRDARARSLGNDRTALVTGSSSGLGRKIAEALDLAGFRTIGLDKVEAKDRDTTILCDLADSNSIERAIREVSAITNSLDILVNNAAHIKLEPLAEYWFNLPEVAVASRVNFDAPLILVSGLLPLLENAMYPLCINISSTSAYGTPFAAHYAMSKGAINSLTHAINEEFRIGGRLRATSLVLSTLNTGFTLREKVAGVTPVSGKDLVLDPYEVGNFIASLALKSAEFFSPEIKLLPQRHKVFEADQSE